MNCPSSSFHCTSLITALICSVLCLFFAIHLSTAEQPKKTIDHTLVQTLSPNVILFGQRIEPHSGFRIYELTGLQQNQKYEVKISYSAIQPAHFHLETLSELPSSLLSHGAAPPSHSRKLLNIEKIVLNPLKHSNTNHGKVYVRVTAERESHSFDTAIESEDIVYDIVVEQLLLGVLPQSSLPLLFILLFIIVVVVFVVAVVVGTSDKRTSLMRLWLRFDDDDDINGDDNGSKQL